MASDLSNTIRYLRDFVAIPSVNPMGTDAVPAEHAGERRYAEHVAERLRQIGLDTALVGTGERISVVAEARVCLGAVASYPVSVPTDGLVGQELSDETIATFAAAAARPAKPLDNTDYHLSWRKRVCAKYIALALKELRGDPPESLGLLARTAARLPVLSS